LLNKNSTKNQGSNKLDYEQCAKNPV